ncbi:MAG: hypothetical protein DKM50_02755 [Candidatus Margulisiibacteriota bacterium]|nr:MAG: hypothetical protein A2X43_03470 [Candidatus Margulisbacteria bacterium GWD2_39_127]OGI04009.1 MAG: hypothetical protein A2X42_11715 [Candidatus Margulisbacteria bacterium GWF2_38_17]OGI06532.1 MAG: hypothetical protein A2X41_02595 [Candidatus Margulisbacteria bacterium GWE2_39_32]PZM83213.1 MAG: hypothetical protein DKM50_02755 [Candidatus Margulisiibacteriota bacterium]HAR62482.1 hypothetical protein [Candidatus Margulisiibacteriota bacterium]
MQNFKIMMITDDFLPNIGGIASHIHELSRFLVKKGHQVTVLHHIYGQGSPDIEYIEGIKVIRIYTSSTLPKLRFLIKLFSIAKYIYCNDSDVIHFHDFPAGPIVNKCIFSKKKSIFTNHSSQYLEWFDSPKKSLLPFLMRGFSSIIAPSEELKQKADFYGNAYFISNGVDTEKFSLKTHVCDDYVNKKYNIRTANIILCPRRLEPKNGVRYLIEAIPHIKSTNYQIVVVGGGFDEEKEKMLKFLKINNIEEKVVFTGNIPNHLMVNFFCSARIVVLPSLMEATSISALEGMSCSRPILCTDVGGLPFLVKDRYNGFVVPPCDSLALAEKIDVLLSSPELCEEYSKNSRKIVEENFSWDAIASEVLGVYNFRECTGV